jgi:IS30 family transposase
MKEVGVDKLYEFLAYKKRWQYHLEEIKFAQNQLNERPRKVLDWECPKKEFKKLVGALES